MLKADSAKSTAGQSAISGSSRCDVLVVGGGIMGLWAALSAARRGLSVVLVDKGRLGQGTSGGLLGALMAHMPDNWNDKKQFQFDALVTLEGEIAALEDQTGLSAGYRRSGRLLLLYKERARENALRHQSLARIHWQSGEATFAWNVTDRPPIPGFPVADAITHGFVLDTLAARVAPRRYGALLAAVLAGDDKVTIHEDREVQTLDPGAGTAELVGGERVSFGHVIIAAGCGVFPLLDRFTGTGTTLGQGVKGQAALLSAEIDPDLPLIYANGLYVVPHDGGTVAIGSTSEDRFDAPFSTDRQLEDLIDRARALVPALADAPVIERWAGLRPKAIGRDPLVGAHPDWPRLVALTGGFKVSFGIAHRLAAAALDVVAGDAMTVPESFTFESHLAAARLRDEQAAAGAAGAPG